MLLAIEFPDAAGDAATGKRTLVVRLGAPRAAQLYVAITAARVRLAADRLRARPAARIVARDGDAAPSRSGGSRGSRDHADAAAFERLTFFAVFLLVATAACALASWVIESCRGDRTHEQHADRSGHTSC